MTENGGGRGSGAADSWFKPTENRYRTQSEYQDPLEEENDDAAVFPDSGGYAGLSSSRPPMVEPYPEALGGPPPAAPPSTHAISYPGASQAAFQPLTRVPGDHDEDPAQDTGERGFPGVAASAQVPLPPEESGSTGDEVWGRDSWAPSGAQQSDSEDAPTADDTPWGAPEPSATGVSWNAPEGASADPATAGSDTGAWNPARESGPGWDPAPGSGEGSSWPASDGPLGGVPGASASWDASDAPAAGEPRWDAPVGADPSLDGPVGSDAGAWTPERPVDDAPWGAPDGATLNPDSAGSGPDADSRGPARSEDSDAWNPAPSADDAPWGTPSRTDDAPWSGPDQSWDPPVGADPSLDGPVASDAGAWTPE
ncbi:hypothetical protein, partial [Nocardiopsis sp. NRRL B-16309]|uniref:hypothetical protein n=1 Tax=Nocardiopsis sp. NRRL B-16309 TaxID=1519494 RepID=UPI000AD2AC2D